MIETVGGNDRLDHVFAIVLKLPNRVRCYEAMTQFFSQHIGER